MLLSLSEQLGLFVSLCFKEIHSLFSILYQLALLGSFELLCLRILVLERGSS